MNKWQIICPLAVILGCGLFAAFGYMEGRRGDIRAMQKACLTNLQEIEDAKKKWADHDHKGTNEVPTWDDLVGPYLNGKRACPSGGIYTLGTFGEKPKCSIESHQLPP